MLISSRRWGKSSLVKQVEIDIKNKNVVFCYIDLFLIKDESEFYQKLASTVIKQTSSKLQEVLNTTKTYFKNLIPKISIGADTNNDFELSFELKDLNKNFEEILNLAENIAKKKGIRLVICIDEFQNLSRFNNPLLFQQRLRASWQHHKEVSYCLYGSKKHMMIELFQKKNMPFYRFGDIMFLEKIETTHWIKYIQKQFKSTSKSISKDLAQKIALKVKNHSYYVQQLAHLVWVRTEVEVTEKILQEAEKDLFNQNSTLFNREVEHLSNTQINFLRALVNQETNFHSAEIIQTYKLGSSSNVTRIKNALEKKEIIDTFLPSIEIIDPVFELWFKTKFG